METTLLIGGLDSSGGAGLHQDIKTVTHFNVHAFSVLTTLVLQNNQQVIDVYPIPANVLMKQIDTIKQSFPLQAIKIGLIICQRQISALSRWLLQIRSPVVWDPIVETSSGYPLLADEQLQYCREKWLPNIFVVTPNLREVEKLLSLKINNAKDVEKAANLLLTTGVKHVIIKGGHSNTKVAADFWTNGQETLWLSSSKFDKNVRGTGCVFASALAANIANGKSVSDAFVIAKCYLQQGIECAQPIEKDHAFFNHRPSSLPQSELQFKHNERRFPSCDKISFYPIVDNFFKLKTLIDLGIHTIQLRIKSSMLSIDKIVEQACNFANEKKVQLFINDYWQLAIKYQAYGVHLGQADLLTADLAAIHAAGLRLGISTHSQEEVIAANSLHPSYIAIGPIFKSPTKTNLTPLGIKQLIACRHLTKLPLVAIGGITKNNVAQCLEVGVDGCAVISALATPEWKTEAQAWREVYQVS